MGSSTITTIPPTAAESFTEIRPSASRSSTEPGSGSDVRETSSSSLASRTRSLPSTLSTTSPNLNSQTDPPNTGSGNATETGPPRLVGSDPNTGAIIGGLVGGLMMTAIVVGAVVYVGLRKKKHRHLLPTWLQRGIYSLRRARGTGGQRSAEEEEPIPETSDSATSLVPQPIFGPPLDDYGLKFLLSQLDDSIINHASNWMNKSDIHSDEWRHYIHDPEIRTIRHNFLYKGKYLLGDETAREQALQATLAYYVFTAVVDMCILPKQYFELVREASPSETVAYRVSFCRKIDISLTKKQEAQTHVLKTLNHNLGRHHLPEGTITNKLCQESLCLIAEQIVSTTLQLGQQADTFVFQLRYADLGKFGDRAHQIVGLGKEFNSTDYELYGDKAEGAVIRALLSPGVVRVSAREPEHEPTRTLVRKSTVFVAPAPASHPPV